MSLELRRNWVFVSRSIYQMVSDLQLGGDTFQDNGDSKFKMIIGYILNKTRDNFVFRETAIIFDNS